MVNNFASNENFDGIIAASIASTPSYLVGVVSLLNRSSPGHINPVRQMEILGIPNFFDHAGNCINGYMIAAAVIVAGSVVDRKLSPEESYPKVIAFGAAATAVGANVAYEAGIQVTPYPAKSPDAPFDAADAVFGGIAGILFSAVYCGVALRQKRKSRSKETLAN